MQYVNRNMTSHLARWNASWLSGILFAAAFASSAAAEVCQSGICANSVTNGKYVSVTYRVRNGPVSHVNIRSGFFNVSNCSGVCPDPLQREGARDGSFSLRRNTNGPTPYSIQACVRGGFLQRSSCGRWANFRHGS
jgi:hypothetical protein